MVVIGIILLLLVMSKHHESEERAASQNSNMRQPKLQISIPAPKLFRRTSSGARSATGVTVESGG
jgi:hypothetical protein